MKPPKFKPHMNRSLGKYYHSERDYKADMKKNGIEPYQGEISRPKLKPYERSDWAKAMHEDIKSRNGRPPGGRFVEELSKRGINQKSYEQAMNLARKGG